MSSYTRPVDLPGPVDGTVFWVDPDGPLAGPAHDLLHEYLAGAYPPGTSPNDYRLGDRQALAAVTRRRGVPGRCPDHTLLDVYVAYRGAVATVHTAPDAADGVVAVKERRDWGGAEITRLYVRPHARGHRIGRALLTAATHHAAWSDRPVYLTAYALDSIAELHSPDAIAERPTARHLYRSAGYVEDNHPTPDGLDRMVWRPTAPPSATSGHLAATG